MAKGFDSVREAASHVEQKRAQTTGPGALYFRLQDGEQTIVRFLEQDDDIVWCWMHEVPVEGRAFGRQVPCLDQDREGNPCPGCERDLDRRFRGFVNVILEDAPVFQRDAENKIIRDNSGKPITTGTEPQAAVWSAGIRLFEELDEINANYKGLTSRRFKVKRKGAKLDTKYVVVPEDIDAGTQEFSENEKKIAATKFDLNQFVTPPDYEDLARQLGGGSNGYHQGPPADNPNPFMRRNQG